MFLQCLPRHWDTGVGLGVGCLKWEVVKIIAREQSICHCYMQRLLTWNRSDFPEDSKWPKGFRIPGAVCKYLWSCIFLWRKNKKNIALITFLTESGIQEKIKNHFCGQSPNVFSSSGFMELTVQKRRKSSNPVITNQSDTCDDVMRRSLRNSLGRYTGLT